MKLNPTILSLIFLLLCTSLFSQEVVCEGSPCTSNDFTIDYFYLGDENGNEFGPGYCESGTTVDAHLWINFTANSNANRYDLYLHFNLYVNGVFIDTIDECFYDGQSIPTNVTLDTYNFNWECGSEIVLRDLYMSWQTNNHGSCECARSHCYSNPTVIVLSPLIANFEFSPSCLTAFTVDFVSTTSGGTAPYTFLWEFGDGATSTEENPSHTYTSTGPFTVTLTVMDAENTDSHGFEILNFDSNIPPELVAPENIDLEGCDTTDIPILNYSETPIEITEIEFTNLGGNLVLGNDIVSLTYEDTSSGTCPIIITRTFTIIDSCNKTDVDVQLFTINDTILPTASNPGDITVQCISEVPVADISVVLDADDNCSNPTVNFVSDVSDNLLCPESITRTYSVSDDCNNSIIVTQNIIISDDIDPTASNPADILVQCIADIPVPNINVVTDEADNCSTPTVAFVSETSDNLSCPETITRTYSVTDACGNSINVTQNIIINDDIDPTASNPTDINVQCITDVPASDVSIITDATDNCSTPIVDFGGDVSDNATCPETITRTYSVTDACGNILLVTQNIIVNDDIDPTASNPADVNVQCIADIPPSDESIITDEADNCSTPIVAFVADVSDNLSCPETITRTYSVTDDCGNSINVTQVIIVNDDVLPTASNPANINVQCIGDVPTEDINIITDEADNCSTPTVAFVSDVSNNSSCPETITRTYSVTDDCGNTINVSQSIIIIDDVLPTASNPADVNVQCISDVPSFNINVITDEADNCSTPIVAFVSDISDNLSCPETITRTYTVTDDCGNSINVTQNIIVNDDVLPTASNPADINVQCISDVPTPDMNLITDAADNCSTPTVEFGGDVSDRATCPETITRTYTVTDDCGNSIDVTQNIIVNDDVAPTASNLSNINVQCIADIPPSDESIITDEADNCSTPIVAFVSDVSNNLSCPETITRTYSVADECGNTLLVTQNIIVSDDILPTASNPANISVQCIGDIPPADVTIINDEADNCATPTVAFVSDVSNLLTCPETITRTYSITDDCGNSINVAQNIIVNDDVLPTASNPADINLECGDGIPSPNPNDVVDEADNCGIPTVFFKSDVSNGLCPEIITRTFEVIDQCNNSILVTQQLIYSDSFGPTLLTPFDANLTVSCIAIPEVPVLEFEDACSSNLTISFTETDTNVNNTIDYVITRNWTVTDECGNASNFTQIINVIITNCLTPNCNSCGPSVDDIDPTASNPVTLDVSCTSDIPSPDVNVVIDEADNCVLAPLPIVTFISETISIDCLEKVTRIYRVTDECGNYIDVTHIINVVDNVLPTASNPPDLDVTCSDPLPSPDVNVVTDEADNCSTPVVEFVSEYSNNACLDTIVRTYSVTDNCGNSILVEHTINVVDDIDPTASNPADINVQCIGDIPNPDINAVTDEADNCSTPTVAFVSDVSDNLSCPETITRTYNVTDACGNSINVTQNIIVNDDVLPTASNPTDINVQCITNVPVFDVSIITDATDNCSTPIVDFVSNVSDNLSCPETITRTYSVTDDCGNSINVTQNIIVNDDVLPTASNPSDISVKCIGDVPAFNVNVITDEADNCSTPTVNFVSVVSNNLSCPETITRTYSVTDDCGNSINVTQNIIVNDDVLPTASNPADVNVQCISDIPPSDVNIITDEADNCSIPTVSFVSDVSDNLSCPETITRTYSITDECGNSINVTQNIIINDDVLPTASNPASISVQCIEDVPAFNVNVITDEADNCSTPIIAFVSDVSDNLSCPETITRTYSVTDDCGNSINVTQNIIVNDDVVPTASNPSDINVQCISDVPAFDVNVIADEADNCSTPTVAFVSDISDNLSCPETITRTYSVADSCGNSINITQNIIVNDDVVPTASNPSDINVQCIGDVPPSDINIITDEADNCSTPTVAFVSDVSNNSSCPETITRTYSVTDTCGNSINVTQNIIVSDDVLPTASNPADISVKCISDVPAPDIAIITDEDDNCSTPTVAFVSDVSDNSNCPETITRTYSVSDDCENSINVTQNIIVNDDVLPTANNPETVTIQCIGNLPTPNINVVADASDNCSIPTVQFVSDVSDNVSCLETIIRTYSITDSCGNSINVTQNFIISDDILPTASNPETIYAQCSGEILPPNTNVVTDEADNCSVPTVEFISEISDNQTCPETITRTYSVTDDCGNSINVIQTIIINDNINPEMISNNDEVEFTIRCEEVPDVPIIEFRDNCTTDVDINFTETITTIDESNYDIIRNWIASDDCNNQTSFTQTIHVRRLNENRVQIVDLCIDDSPIDLYTFISSVALNLEGHWESTQLDLLIDGVFTPADLPMGIYEFSYIFENNACSSINTFIIDLNDDCVYYPCIESTADVTISKMVTPNNDSYNDHFEISYALNENSNNNNICDITTNVKIFNRWGKKIYESEGDYQNDWCGDSPLSSLGRSDNLPTGTYYYIVDLKNSDLKPIQGYIYLGTK